MKFARLLIALCTLAGAALHAASPPLSLLESIPTPSPAIGETTGATRGYAFQTGPVAPTVYGLGWVNYSGNPDAGKVGLWANNGTELAEVSVTGLETLYYAGAFSGRGARFVGLATPLPLQANTIYVVGFRSDLTGLNQSIFAFLNRATTFAAGYTYLEGRTTDTMQSSLAFPSTANGRTGFFGPTVAFSPVPLQQTIDFTGPSTFSFSYPDPVITLSATASTGLEVTFSLNSGSALLAGNILTITGAGQVSITASQAGDATYGDAPDVTRSFTINPGDQLITFAAAASATMGDADFDPGATVDSNQPITYQSSNSAVATIVANQVHLIASGQTTITAQQTGSANWNAASPKEQVLTVSAGTQVVRPGGPAGVLFGSGPFTVTASSDRGLTDFTFEIESGPGSITATTNNSATITPTAVGLFQVKATQAGTAQWLTASVTKTVQVSAGDQTITFGALDPVPFGTPPFLLTASAISGLDVTYSSPDTSVVSISGSTVTIVGVGSATIYADQPGDGNWQAAPQVSQTLIVNKGDQTITFPTIGKRPIGDEVTLAATASSGLPITYEVTGPATLTGNTVTLTAAGNVTIRATQPGDANWNGATAAEQAVLVETAITGAPEASAPLGTLYLSTYAVTSDPGLGTAKLTVLRTNTTGAGTVRFHTMDGSAKAGRDYVAAEGELTFAAGQPDQQISIAILPKAPRGLTFTVALSNPSPGLALGNPQAGLVTVTTPISAYHQYALYELDQTRNYFIAGDQLNGYEAYANYFYFLYLDESDLTSREAKANLNAYYQNLANVYWLAYIQQGDPASAQKWYDYLRSFRS